MSASRTLLRRQETKQSRERGPVSAQKPGTPSRRILSELRINDRIYTVHATRGKLKQRVPR